MDKNYELIMKMMDYENGSAHRIQHFLKVYELATIIGEGEGISDRLMHILQTAALTHDIGIRTCMEKYGTAAGPAQEAEGPALAKAMLEELGYEDAVIDRVCYLIAHHHTYTDVDGLDYRILIEADFLVNMLEDHYDAGACRSAYERIFVTTTGKRICRKMYDVRK